MKPSPRLSFAILLVGSTALAVPSGHKWFTLPPTWQVFNHSEINGMTPGSFGSQVLPRIQAAWNQWTKNVTAGTWPSLGKCGW